MMYLKGAKMAEHMVRKQIYLPPRQNLLLKRLAKQRGVSEAEVIRRAIEREADFIAPVQNGEKALANMLVFAEKRKEIYAGQGKPFQWNRAEIYEERESRWFKSEPKQ
jgi:hypothetical protein